MDFIKACIEDLKNLEKGYMWESNGFNYFSLERVQCLPNIIKENNIIDELSIIPYYVYNSKRMDLYDYSLSIRIVESLQGKEKYFLEETGKKCVKDINSEVIDKLNNTYYEVKQCDCEEFIGSLKRYIKYMEEREPIILEQLKQEVGETVINDDILYELI